MPKNKTLYSLTYQDKLFDPRWREKRERILNRDNHTCKHCGVSKMKGLNIHHIKYVGEPWECPDAFLITLCFDCHGKAEDLKIEAAFFYKIVMEKNITKDHLRGFLFSMDDVKPDNWQLFFDALGWLFDNPEEMDLIIEKYNSTNFLR